jgi:leucyl aminopeptidase
MLAEARRIAAKHPGLKLTTIEGDDLLKEGFRLMHAVGRASSNEPVFVCLEWRGKPESEEFVGLVGKGVTFDAGGLNLKPTTGISGMHNDKHGACSVLSAIDGVATLNFKSNVVAVLGLV